MKLILVLITLLFFSAKTTGQRGNNWQFGYRAGLDFNSGVPVPTNYGKMEQLEGCASISDTSGNLLFYTDGVTVWNRQHTVMPNGDYLFGNYNSTQSAIIVPFPNNIYKYYVFTLKQGGSSWAGGGLYYSVVNILLDGGLGDIEQKNIQLYASTYDQVTAVEHCNRKDVWVITKKGSGSGGWSRGYLSFLITANGINSPIHSPLLFGTSGGGYLKISPDGTKLADANRNGLGLFDFNSSTGIVSNRKVIITEEFNVRLPAYGIEFSPNSKLLYATGARKKSAVLEYAYFVNQYNFLDSPAVKILNSKIELDIDSTTGYNTSITHYFGALQIGPDEKIYSTVYPIGGISVINNPNVPGFGCNYIRGAIRPAPGSVNCYGLPTFIQSYYKGSFTYKTSCTSTDADFYYSKPVNALSVKWDFGDPLSGSNNNAFVDSPAHMFSAPGIYEVKVITYLSCRNDTLKKKVKIDPVIVDLGTDRGICDDSLVVLNPQSGSNRTYFWQNNSTDSTLTVSSGGLYWVEVTNPGNGCKVRDSLLLTNKPNPINNLGIDTFLCERKSLLLDAGNSGAQFTWQDNSASQTFLAKKPGSYTVKVNLDGCIAYDTINIRGEYFPRVYLGNDTAICDGMTITLKPLMNHAENASFLWSNGDTSQSISISQPGNYSLELRNICGTAADGIIVKKGVCKLYMPTGFTPNNDGKNDVLKPGYGENVTSFSMEIYNRWGEKIFASEKIYNGWDGKLKGVLQPAGVYIWFIRYRVFNDPVEYTQKGTVSLIY